MNRHGRATHLHYILLASVLSLWPAGCSQDSRNSIPPGTPTIRVLLLENQQQVTVSATAPPMVRMGEGAATRQLNFPRGQSVPVSLTPAGWQIGTAALGMGQMLLEPSEDGSLAISDQAYHGRYRFIPTGPSKFDVVNELDLESYLRGVLRAELFASWHDETYKAQAIVARTYALYEMQTAGKGRHFDVYGDVRSQAYGGIGMENARSREATEATAGIVVAYGPPGRETIFKSYFSSCCGGAGQSAADAFGDSYAPVLAAQRRDNCCTESPKFNWGPIVIPKSEITRRMRAWGSWKKQPQKDIGAVARIEIFQVNQFNRPIRFTVTDGRGMRYSMRSEDLREAVNFDAGPKGTKIFSSFCQPVDDGPNIRFINGHGYGHGVGMCQWCAEHQAAGGWNDEAIILSAFPGAKLLRAY